MTQKKITHFIQEHVLSVLESGQVVRFRDLKLPDVDTNLLSYHIGLLRDRDMISKVDGGYVLSSSGLAYFGKNAGGGNQIDVRVVLVVQNSDGDILMQKQSSGPGEKWGLPQSELQVGDMSIQMAAENLAATKLGTKFSPDHAGECYIRTVDGQKVTTSTLAHVFRHYIDEIEQTDDIKWMRPHKLGQVNLVPGTEDVMTRTFFRDPYFFEEYTVNC